MKSKRLSHGKAMPITEVLGDDIDWSHGATADALLTQRLPQAEKDLAGRFARHIPFVLSTAKKDFEDAVLCHVINGVKANTDVATPWPTTRIQCI